MVEMYEKWGDLSLKHALAQDKIELPHLLELEIGQSSLHATHLVHTYAQKKCIRTEKNTLEHTLKS